MSIDRFEVKDADPEYVYRWCNTDERAMLRHQDDGFEPVLDTRPELKTAASPVDPVGGVTRRRGADLVLCKVPRKQFEETVGARRRALREQQQSATEAAVNSLNETMRAELKRAGKQTRQALAFNTSDDPDFGSQLSKQGR